MQCHRPGVCTNRTGARCGHWADEGAIGAAFTWAPVPATPRARTRDHGGAPKRVDATRSWARVRAEAQGGLAHGGTWHGEGRRWRIAAPTVRAKRAAPVVGLGGERVQVAGGAAAFRSCGADGDAVAPASDHRAGNHSASRRCRRSAVDEVQKRASPAAGAGRGSRHCDRVGAIRAHPGAPVVLLARASSSGRSVAATRSDSRAGRTRQLRLAWSVRSLSRTGRLRSQSSSGWEMPSMKPNGSVLSRSVVARHAKRSKPSSH